MRKTGNLYINADVILHAYYQGVFPMANERGEIGFYAYDPRGIVPLDDRFRVRKSLAQILRRGDYEVRYDTAPVEVLRGCSRSEENIPLNELWLSDRLIDLYMDIYDRGLLHTVEVWRNGRLIGGLYGLVFGTVFSGESMFSREPYASQIALVHLVELLRRQGFDILDAQMPSDHLKQFGLYEITQAEYLPIFHKLASLPNRPFLPDQAGQG